MQEIRANNEAIEIVVRRRSSRMALASPWRWALTLYLGFRVLLSIWAAWVSWFYPFTPIEQTVPLWPISASFGVWLERLLLWPTARYDVFWNIGIAEQGYAYHIGSTAFHPLYPLLIGLLGRVLGGDFLLAGWLIAQVCCVAMLALLYKLVLLDYDEGVARRTTLFLIGSPLGFVLLIPYAESLLLLCIVGAWYAARLRQWWLAGVLGAGAALTKQPGVVVVLPLLWELWRAHRDDLRARQFRPLLGPLLALALVPLGLLAYLVYRATLGDAEFSWSNPSTLIWSLLVTPSYDRVWNHHFTFPWVSVQIAIERLQTAPFFYLILNMFLMSVMAAIVCYTLLRQRGSYVLYSLCLLLMNLSIMYPLIPYISVVRRFLIVFPLFVKLGVWGRSPRLCALILCCNTVLWVYISEAYVRFAYIP